MKNFVLSGIIFLLACSDRSGQSPVPDADVPAPDAGITPVTDAGADADPEPLPPRNMVISSDSARIDVMEDGYWVELGQVVAESGGAPVVLTEALSEIVLREGTMVSESPPASAEIWVDMVRSRPESGTAAIRFEFRSGVLPGDMAGVRVYFP